MPNREPAAHIPASRIRIKRVYEAPDADDGQRVLVDRLWPRGISKDKAQLRQWMKEIAPSTELRTWFGHDPDKWEEFRRRYGEELRTQPELLASLRELARVAPLTLVYSAHDEQHNQAVVLREVLLRS